MSETRAPVLVQIGWFDSVLPVAGRKTPIVARSQTAFPRAYPESSGRRYLDFDRPCAIVMPRHCWSVKAQSTLLRPEPEAHVVGRPSAVEVAEFGTQGLLNLGQVGEAVGLR